MRLQLDGGNADPATFARFLSAAATLIAHRRALRLPLPSADDLRDVPGSTHRLVSRLALALDPPWVLVRDNVQELGSAPLLRASIVAALAKLPQGVHTMALSREQPPPPHARLLAGQQFVVIDEPARALLVAQAAQAAQAARLVAQGRDAILSDSLLALPEAAHDDPRAWYWLGCCELGTEPLGALRYFERANRRFMAAGDARGLFYAAAADRSRRTARFALCAFVLRFRFLRNQAQHAAGLAVGPPGQCSE